MRLSARLTDGAPLLRLAFNNLLMKGWYEGPGAFHACSEHRCAFAHLEEGQDVRQVAGPLREELRLMADWLGLESVSLPRAGALAKAMGRMR